MWFILVGAIIAIVVGGIYIYVIKGGLSAGGKNVGYLSSCKNQGGHCKIECDKSTESGFFKSGGCPDEDGSGKIDGSEQSGQDYCCILKET